MMMCSFIFKKKGIGLLALFAINTNIYGQENNAVFNDSIIQQEIMPIEIRAVRVNNKSPFAISNLSKEDIKNSNLGQDIPYILNQTPSVVVMSDGGMGIGYTGMRIRGTDISRTNFTINGIPVNDAESQGAFFVNYPDLLSSTHSIQVQRGVGSSTNGSGAFGASVNISNLHQEDKAYAETSNTVGSFNTFKHTFRASTGKLKGGFNFDIRLSKINSDGYIERASSDLKALHFIAGWQSKNQKTSLKFNVFTGKEKTGQAWDGVAENDLEINRQKNTLGIMADGNYYDDQTDNYQQDFYQLFFNHKINNNWSAHGALFLTRGKGYYNEYRLNEKFSDYNLPDFDTFSSTNLTRQLWLDNYYYGAVYSLQYNTAKTEMIAGGSWTRYDGNHYGYVTWADYGIPLNHNWYNNPAYKADFNMYVKLQQKLSYQLYAFADLQYKNIDYYIDGFRKNTNLRSGNKYNFFNPKIGLSYLLPHLNTSGESKIYASFAVANKEPNRDDFEASTGNIPKHESLYNWEAGYFYQQKDFNFGANLYYMNYKNQLVLTGKINDVGAYTRTNVNKSYRTGIELTASAQPLEWLRITANTTFSQNKIIDFTEYIDDYDNANGDQMTNYYKTTDISFSPNTIAGGMVSFEPFVGQYQQHNFYIDIIAKYVSRQYLDNTTNSTRSINPYGLTDLRFRYNFRPSFIKELGITLALNNFFNKMYEANGYTYSYKEYNEMITRNFYYPQAGFNWMLGLSLRW